MTDRYTYSAVWEAASGMFVATCAEFPALSFAAADEASARAGIKELVHQDMRQQNPAPTYLEHLKQRIRELEPQQQDEVDQPVHVPEPHQQRM